MKKIYSFLILLFATFSVKAQTDFVIGSGTTGNSGTSYPAALQDFYEGSRSQYLYLASELQAAGMVSGNITALRFNVTALNTFSGTIPQYTISMLGTSTSSLDETIWESGATPVTNPVDYVPTLGVNTFTFTTPFFWNGTDNIVVEICNGDPNNNTVLDYTQNVTTPWTTGLSFNGSHTYRADNLGNLCGTTTVTNSGTLTTRPDIIFYAATPPPCSGTPNGGTTISSKDSVCPSIGFSLSVTGATLGSALHYQWEQSINGTTFAPIANSDTSRLFISNITTTTYYKRKITCGTNSSYSTVIMVYLNPLFQCYCNPLTGTVLHSSTSPTIENVAIAGGTVAYSNSHPGANTAPSLGYVNFIDTSLAPVLAQEVPYTLTVTTSATPTQAAVWVDWNQSGTFEASEYQLITFATGATTADITITPPASATLGFTMARIRIRGATFTTDACESYGSGETEDYVVKIVPGTSCSGTPIGGSATSLTTSICPNKPFNLTVDNATVGVIGLTYRWEYSTNGGTTWDTVANAKGISLSVSGITTATCYRRKITCSGSSSYSTSVCITMNPIFDCYCSPLNGVALHSSTGPTIENVDVSGGIVNYTNSHPGANTAPSLGYVAFTDTTSAPSLAQETAYTLNVTTSATPGQAAVWIDWDHSGSFEPSEYQVIPFASGATSAFVTFTPPATSLLGYTLMRVRVRSVTFTTNACENYGSGETEDYVIKIVPGTSCTGKPLGGVTASSTSLACNGIPISLTVTGATENVVNLSYQWQDSIPGSSIKFNDISGATSKNYTAMQNVAKYYRRKIKCNSSIDSSYSAGIFVDQLAVTYATVPFAEDFENSWIDGCGDANSRTIPNNSWRNYPLMGDSSWRRDDDASAANWGNPTLGTYTPSSSTGTYSARFHSYQATSGTSGSMDLFLDCSGGSSLKQLSYDFINTSGNDSLQVFLSTDAGINFTKIGVSKTASTWTNKLLQFTSASSTTIVRLKATSDFGTTDIGVDNISVTRLNAVDLAADSLVSPSGSFSITSSGKVILRIKNAGAAPIDFSTNNATIGVRITDPNGSPVPVSPKILNSGVLAVGATRVDTITNTANFGTIGTYTIKAGVGIAGDPILSNDSTFSQNFVTTSVVVYAIANGNWGDVSTWSTNSVPTAADTVNITGYNVSLGGSSSSPYFCSSLGVGTGGTLTVGTGVLNIGTSGGSSKALTFAKAATLNISGGTLNQNGFILFNDSSNFIMSSGILNIDGNSGLDANSVTTGIDLLGFGTSIKPFSFGTINLTGGTITIVDPHRFGGNAIAYRGSVPNNIGSGNTIILGDGISSQTASTGTTGFLVNTTASSARLSLGNLLVNGGNAVGNRFGSFGSNVGINGSLTINNNSDLRSTFATFISGDLINNGIMSCSAAINFQTYLSGSAGAVSSPQSINGSGVYRNNVPATSVSNVGSGYSVGDILTLTGGTAATQAKIFVSAVTSSGNISSSVMLSSGSYSVAPVGAQAVTGGTGTGATFSLGNAVTPAKFAGMTFNNISASGITINSLGTSLSTQTGTVAGNGILTMIAGVINNDNEVFILGTSPTLRGVLTYTSGYFTSKLRRWFNAATNASTTGDFPVGKNGVIKPARIEFTTAPTKGGAITAEFIATAPGLGGFPINDGISLVNIANDGYWKLETDSITGGAYTVSLTDSGIANAQTLSTLRVIKRAVSTTNWSVEGAAGVNTGSLTKPVVVRTGLITLGEFAIAGASDNVLPISSLKFSGEKINSFNQLTWTVVNEVDIRAYELQRSSISNNFESIAVVSSKASNNNNINLQYSFIDNNIVASDVYYRLKQISKDGSISYSNIVLIKGLKISGILVGNVYPNPAKNLVNINIASSGTKKVTIQITDVLGKVLLNKGQSLNTGDNNIQINVNTLASGQYLISVIDETGKKSNSVSIIKE